MPLVTARESWLTSSKESQQWVKELNEKAGADIRIVIVGNKIDLDDHTVLMNTNTFDLLSQSISISMNIN